jgi:hypothetical protein
VTLLIPLVLVAGCESASDPTNPATSGAPSTTSEPTLPPPITSDTPTTTPVVEGLTAATHVNLGSIVVVTWTQNVAGDVHLEYSFDDGVWLSSPTVSREVGAQEELLLGVPYGETVTWRLVSDVFTSPDAVIDTAALPANVPPSVVTISKPDLYDAVNAPYWMVGLAEVSWATDPWWVLIVDREGRVVWAKRTANGQTSMHARVARDNASLLIDRNTYWASGDGGADSEVDRMLIDGQILHTYQTPGLHHPFVDLPDDVLAYGAYDSGTERIRTTALDGTVSDLFNCEEWLASEGITGGCSSNTLTYHEPTNKLLFSLYSIETIIEVDRDLGTVDRWFGHGEGSYAFFPSISGFWWQHGGHITAAGTLITSSDKSAAGEETVIHEYEIDDSTRTLNEVWNFGLGDGVFGSIMGEPVELPGGNVVHNTGGLARLREGTPDGQVVWDIEWDCDAIGRSMPIVDLYALRR